MPRNILGLAALAAFLSLPASAQTYVTFSVPFADGTVATGINDDGVVAGFFAVGGAGLGSFVRTTDGTLTTFGPTGSRSSRSTGIDKHGTIVGTWQDENFAQHGFIRSNDGTITKFDPPNSIITFVSAVHGETVGDFSDAANRDHAPAFRRTRAGRFEIFHCGDARYTSATAVNGRGAIAGSWSRRTVHNYTPEHGFVRGADGTCVTFDAPGAVQTIVTGINNDGTITGYFHVPREHGTKHGFVRAADGTIATFDVSGAKATEPTAINAAGTIVGTYGNNPDVPHAFVRTADGTVTPYDAPDSESTTAFAINDSGVIVGSYLSKSGDSPAYIRSP